MVKIEINGKTLSLYNGQKIPLKMRNPIMYEDVLPKYYTLPFTIPLDMGVNNYILEYPALWQNKNKLGKKIDCLVYLFGSNTPRKGVLNINSVSETAAEVNIVIGKNADDIADKLLYELDLGNWVLEDTVYCRYSIKVFCLSAVPAQDFVLTINEHTFSVSQSLWALGGVAVINAFVSQINAANLGIVASLKQNDLPGPPESGGDTSYYLDLKATLPGTHHAFELNNLVEQLDNYNSGSSNYYWRFPNSGSIFSDDVVTQTAWAIDHLLLMRTAVKNMIDSYNVDTSVFTLPIVENVSFIDDVDNYGGFQNSDLFSTVNNLTRQSYITPFVPLHIALKKVFKVLGFDAFGTFFDSVSIQRFVIYSNVASDYQFRKYGSVDNDPVTGDWYYIGHGNLVNIHSSVVNIAKHLPDMTVKDFLTEIRKAFNLRYIYNYSNNTVEIYLLQENTKVLQQKVKNYTNNIINSWQLQNTSTNRDTLKLFDWEQDESDEKPKQLGKLDYQQPLIIDSTAKKEIIPKISSIGEELVENYSLVSVVKIPGVYNNQGSVAKFKLLQYFHRPETGLGFSEPPDWVKIPTGPSTYYLMPFAFCRDTYPKFSYISDWSLRWDTEKGLYNRCWKAHTQLINDGVQLKLNMSFSQSDLEQIEENIYHLLNHSIAIWKDIDVLLGDNCDYNTTAEVLYHLL